MEYHPIAINGKVYMRGRSNRTETVLVYTPDQDSWDVLPPPPVGDFTIATLRGRLLVVGGQDKSTYRKTNTIVTLDESSRMGPVTSPHANTNIFANSCCISEPSDRYR